MKDLNQKTRLLPYFFLLSLCLLPLGVSAKTLMILGDRLSAGYGIQPQQGWVHLLQKRIEQQYPKQHNVDNASVRGEHTSEVLARRTKRLQMHGLDLGVSE